MVLLLGVFVQIYLFKKKDEKPAGNHGDLKIELRNV